MSKYQSAHKYVVISNKKSKHTQTQHNIKLYSVDVMCFVHIILLMTGFNKCKEKELGEINNNDSRYEIILANDQTADVLSSDR